MVKMVKFMLCIFYHNFKKPQTLYPKVADFGLRFWVNRDLFIEIWQNVEGAALGRKI